MGASTCPRSPDIESGRMPNTQASSRGIKYRFSTYPHAPTSIRSFMALPFGSTEELHVHLAEYLSILTYAYQEWAQTGRLAIRRTVSDEQFRVNKTNTLLNIYAQSFGLLHMGEDKCAAFRNACIDAVVEALDACALRDDLIYSMAQVLENPVESGLWRLLVLYWVLSADSNAFAFSHQISVIAACCSRTSFLQI